MRTRLLLQVAACPGCWEEGKANNEVDVATGLALDGPNQLIYITDYGNCRIQISANFLKRFGQGILKYPWYIAVTEENVFVTDLGLHTLLQFSKKNYKLVKRTGSKEEENDS